MFAARAASVTRVGSGILAPLFAGTSDESTEARSQSIRPASPSHWCMCCRINSHTPRSVHSCIRRQHVIPEPQPISRGKSSHGIPVLSTNTIPVSTWRSASLLRPPLGLGGCAGSSGSIRFHSSSGTSSLAMPASYPTLRRCKVMLPRLLFGFC